MKNPVLSEREKAAFGPRSLKKHGSPEWCWQTLDRLLADYKLIDERFEEVNETLTELRNAQAWKVIPSNKPYGTEEQMLAEELGIDSYIILREINDARYRKLARHGRPKLGEQKGANGTFKRGSHSRTYILARLERDGFHELAAKVRAKKITAKAAAKEAGFGGEEQTVVQRVIKQIDALTKEERREIWDYLSPQFKRSKKKSK